MNKGTRMGFLVDHTDKWVALDSERKKVVASNKNLKGLYKELSKIGDPKVVYMKVPPLNVSFAPLINVE